MKYLKYYLFSLLIIAVDQAIKLAVHYNMEMGTAGEIHVLGDWFKLHYTLNPGMAFGLEIGSKVFLTIFRLISMVVISWYLYNLVKSKAHQGFVWCIAAILGGAVGNVIDSTFYGWLLDNAQYVAEAPSFYPFFYGQVVDMFYLDIWKGYIPESVPIFGGGFYAFWPIFNIADSAIFMGVLIILIRQKTFLAHTAPQNSTTETSTTIA